MKTVCAKDMCAGCMACINMCKKSATKIFTINRNILFKLIGRFYIVQSYTFLNIQNDIIRLHVFLIYEFIQY